jgi:hypothetical protein
MAHLKQAEAADWHNIFFIKAATAELAIGCSPCVFASDLASGPATSRNDFWFLQMSPDELEDVSKEYCDNLKSAKAVMETEWQVCCWAAA